MLCREVFDGALHLLSAETSERATADYRKRLPYLLACFIGEQYGMDASFRARQMLSGDTPFPDTFDRTEIGEEEVFPMSPRFLPAAAYYLASMLVMRENEDFSEALYARYRDALSHIRAGTPMKLERIPNKYRG